MTSQRSAWGDRTDGWCQSKRWALMALWMWAVWWFLMVRVFIQLHSLTMFNLLHVPTIYLWAGKVPKKNAFSRVWRAMRWVQWLKEIFLFRFHPRKYRKWVDDTHGPRTGMINDGLNMRQKNLHEFTRSMQPRSHIKFYEVQQRPTHQLWRKVSPCDFIAWLPLRIYGCHCSRSTH